MSGQLTSDHLSPCKRPTWSGHKGPSLTCELGKSLRTYFPNSLKLMGEPPCVTLRNWHPIYFSFAGEALTGTVRHESSVTWGPQTPGKAVLFKTLQLWVPLRDAMRLCVASMGLRPPMTWILCWQLWHEGFLQHFPTRNQDQNLGVKAVKTRYIQLFFQCVEQYWDWVLCSISHSVHTAPKFQRAWKSQKLTDRRVFPRR